MTKPLLSAFGAALVFLTTVSTARAQTPAAAPPRFSVESLSRMFSGEPVVTLINDRGTAAGRFQAPPYDAFVQPPGGPRQIVGQLPGGDGVLPYDLNENDWLTGLSSMADRTTRPVVWNSRDGLIDLGLLPGGDRGVAFDINNRNQVVGYSNSSTGRQAFLWDQAGGLRALPKPAGSGTATARGINDQGNITGHVYLEGSAHQHATLWTADGRFVDLGDLPGTPAESAGLAINERDHVAGYSLKGQHDQAIFWSQETGMIGLGILPGAAGSIGVDINDNDWVVGSNTTGGPGAFAAPFLWSPQFGLHNLNDLLTPADAGWVVLEANKVNDRGQIIGLARRGQDLFTVRLNPVPEPAGLMLLPAAAGLLRRRRRRRAARRG